MTCEKQTGKVKTEKAKAKIFWLLALSAEKAFTWNSVPVTPVNSHSIALYIYVIMKQKASGLKNEAKSKVTKIAVPLTSTWGWI